MTSILRWKHISVLVLLAEALFFSRISLATLGQTEESVENERMILSGVRAAPQSHGRYTIHEIKNDGMSLREYVFNGTVVGLSWRGVSQPDLSQFLGNYFSEYEATPKTTSRKFGRRSFSSVEGSTFIVKKGGHLRSVWGSACAKALLPQGGSCDDIQ